MKPVDRLLAMVIEAGAVAAGVAAAGPVELKEWNLFRRWIERGCHAGMTYMENYPEIRRDPRLLLERGAVSVVSVAFNYRQHNPCKGVATYALGEDYHKVLRRRLKPVVAAMKADYGGDWRICVDSAPILERYWACKAGIGVRSPFHGNVVVPGVGSMVFLAEIITTLELEPSVVLPYGTFMPSAGPAVTPPAAGVCPTGALLQDGTVDSRKCINYLTIEHPGGLSEEERKMVGGAIFGCDICQRRCVENTGESLPVLPEFAPLPGLVSFLRGENERFDLSRSPLKRSKRFC